jgi:hypothetical protein
MFVAFAAAVVTPVAAVISAPAVLAQGEVNGQFKIPTPPEGKGQILFYRTGALTGATTGCAVFDARSAEKLSSLGNGRYFVLVSEPGPRSFSVKSIGDKDALALEIEPDETQFVRCQMKSGLLLRADIAPSSESEFRNKYKKPKLVDADDMSDAVRASNYPEAKTN